jgi:hypothetical protein
MDSVPECTSSDLVSRRDFLKLWALGFGSLAVEPLRPQLPPEEGGDLHGIGRVTISAIGVYQEPDFKSQRLRWLSRDSIVPLYGAVISDHGYAPNRRWYNVGDGYAHSAYLQRVEKTTLNRPANSIPAAGILGEVTVPFTQSLKPLRNSTWQALYRLYFGSVYWITDLIGGPDGEAWYELTDDRLHIPYCVPAAHLRPISIEEIRPISPQLPAEEKRIEVNLTEQTVYAFEEDRLVFQAPISSGVYTENPLNGIPTETPAGNFHIAMKSPSRHMGDGDLTSSLDAYELPGVPWVSLFHSIGVGFHGTYWHDNFGSPMSHGCVNMRNEDAKWLYRWTTPAIGYSEWYKSGWGTLVKVLN